MKNKLSKGLSLSANPKHLIKGVFLAVTEVFADFFEKISKIYHTPKRSFLGVNNHPLSKSYLDLSEANSPSIQNQNAISLKRKVFSGFSANGLTSKAKNDFDVCGRSMIEMLGVLAIIAVLSVGGIAGYSKAMEKFKLNKIIEQYSTLIYGILEHLDDFKKSANSNEAARNINPDTLQALNLIPQNWFTGSGIVDDYNNTISLFIRPDASNNASGEKNEFIMDIYLGGISSNDNSGPLSQNFSEKMCVELFQNLFLPLHAYAVHAEVYKSSGNFYTFAGDRYCTAARVGRQKCMVDVTLQDIHNACNSCGKTTEYCNVNIHF